MRWHIDVQAVRRRSLTNGPAPMLPCYWRFVGFFNVLVQAATSDHPFYGYSEKSSPLYRAVEFNKQPKDDP